MGQSYIHIIRKIICILLYAALSCMFLSGCKEQAIPTLSEADYTTNDTSVISTGVSVGDSYARFLDAYGDYPLLVSAGDSYEYLTKEVIPFDEDISILLDTFFIDGTPLSIDDICTAYEIEKESFLDTLNSETFLSSHGVIYRYMAFSFSGGFITDIISDTRDFNYEHEYDLQRR